MAAYILNSAVITAPGHYVYQVIDKSQAESWIACRPDFISTIGYEQTAEALSELLGKAISVDRRTIKMAPQDEALVFRLVFPPGTPRIEPHEKGRLSAALLAGHYELGILLRIA